jgi:hypothetical protein
VWGAYTEACTGFCLPGADRGIIILKKKIKFKQGEYAYCPCFLTRAGVYVSSVLLCTRLFMQVVGLRFTAHENVKCT